MLPCVQPAVRACRRPCRNLIAEPFPQNLSGIWSAGAAPAIITLLNGIVKIDRNSGSFVDMFLSSNFYNEGTPGTKWEFGWFVYGNSPSNAGTSCLTGATNKQIVPTVFGAFSGIHTSTSGLDRNLRFRSNNSAVGIIWISDIWFRRIG